MPGLVIYATDHGHDHLPARALRRQHGMRLGHRSQVERLRVQTRSDPARVDQFGGPRENLLQGLTVARAAHLSGFASAETLRRVFVSQVGVSPSVYAQSGVNPLEIVRCTNETLLPHVAVHGVRADHEALRLVLEIRGEPGSLPALFSRLT